MKYNIQLTIDDRKLMVILAVIISVSAIGLVVAYGGSNPTVVGHSWSEMTCDKCISNSNLGDNSVNSNKIIDNTITTADVNSIDGSKITGKVPSAASADTAGSAGSATSAGNANTLNNLNADQIARWGNPCNPAWGGCSSYNCCGGTGTQTCNYWGKELIIRGITVCSAMTNSQSSCGSQSCVDSSCCPSGGGGGG